MPSSRRLLLVRHGQTAWNAERRAQGHADVPLDDLGRRQAEQMAGVVAAYEPVVLVTSDLARARETAAYLEKATGLTAREDAGLREYDVGIRQGLTGPELVERHPDLDVDLSDLNRHLVVPGAETPEDVSARIVPAVQAVLDGLEPGETGVVVTHGAALRLAIAGVLGWPVEAHDSLASMRNCAWAVLMQHGTGPLRLAAYDVSAAGVHPD